MFRPLLIAFESVDEILKCDHSKFKATEQYFQVVLLFMLYKVVLLSLDGIPRYNHTSESFCEYYLFELFTVLLKNVVPTFGFVHSDGDSNESY